MTYSITKFLVFRESSYSKKTALLICLISLSFLTKAQLINQRKESTVDSKPFARKTWQIGVQGGYSPAELLSKNLTVQAYGGYYIADKLLLGLSAMGSQEWAPNVVTINTYAAGPIVRYQLTRTRVSPFVTASYQIGVRHISAIDNRGTQAFVAIESNSNIAIHSRSFTAGLSIGVVPALRIDAALNWQDTVLPSQPDFRYKNGLLQPQFGLNYALGKH